MVVSYNDEATTPVENVVNYHHQSPSTTQLSSKIKGHCLSYFSINCACRGHPFIYSLPVESTDWHNTVGRSSLVPILNSIAFECNNHKNLRSLLIGAWYSIRNNTNSTYNGDTDSAVFGNVGRSNAVIYLQKFCSVLLKYSDELFLLWRLIAGSVILLGYSYWIIKPDFELTLYYLTHLNGYISILTVIFILMTQLMTYFGLRSIECRWIDATKDEQDEVFQQLPEGSSILQSKLYSMSCSVLNTLYAITVPINGIICLMYWTVIYYDDWCQWEDVTNSYIDCIPSWAQSRLLHGYGGWFLQIDWLFSNTPWFFMHGWKVLILAFTYSAFLISNYYSTGTPVYTQINPDTTAGQIYLVIVNVLPLVTSLLMSLLKYPVTNHFYNSHIMSADQQQQQQPQQQSVRTIHETELAGNIHLDSPVIGTIPSTLKNGIIEDYQFDTDFISKNFVLN